MGDRFDGTLARDVPPYRQIVPFLMPTRNQSAVYFEQTIDLTRTLPWLDAFNAGREKRATLFHVFLGALTRTLHERPRLNRFVSGRRIYQRKGIYLTFAAKKKMNDDAPLSTVKMRFDPEEPFADLVVRLRSEISVARSDEVSTVDKELDFFLRLPRPLLDLAVPGRCGGSTSWNLAPRALLEPDPMYTSVFMSHLGSIGIEAAYHHLYEHGNCPIFMVIGRNERIPVVDDDGTVATRTVVKVKYSYDERIEDGPLLRDHARPAPGARRGPRGLGRLVGASRRTGRTTMAYDEDVAARIRARMKRRKGYEEKKMFGGIAFLLHGHMTAGVIGTELMLRLGDEGAAEALTEEHVRPMDFTGKPMKSMVYVAPEGFASDDDLKRWLDRAARFARSLPPR